jgi:glycosyltransferase involved in cell wall biosynthesis
MGKCFWGGIKLIISVNINMANKIFQHRHTIPLMKKINCLFISHVPINSTHGGGAAISLKTFLEHQDFLEIDIIIPLFIGYLFKWPFFIKSALALKPKLIRKVYFLPLPINNCQEGAPISLKARTAYFVNNLLAYSFLPITRKIMQKDEYRFVHLNSLVLNPLICKNSLKQVIHVREVIDANSPYLTKVINSLYHASGLIFIDPRTFKAIKDFSAYKKLPCNAIIKNPFGMTFARQWRKNRQAIFEEFGLGDPADKLFAYIGMLHPIKGTDLIIKAFSEAKFKKAKLLIVGAGNPLYAKHYRSLANDNGDTIVFLGRMEFQEVIKIYAVSDFVVRGDPDFRIGRTIYEALYAGCNLIIPGNINDLDLETGLQPFASRIFFYEPKSSASLTATMQSAFRTTKTSLPDEMPTSNTTQHCEEIKEFLNSCIFE